MSYRLVILGVLAERPQYGYELKQSIARQHFADYIRLSGGGLYYHLRKLREEGYIEEETVEREGNYPDRHIYRITESGRSYLFELLRNALDDAEARRTYDPIDAALAFAFLLPREEVLARLQHQLDMMNAALIAMEATQRFHRRVVEQAHKEADSAARSESLYAQLMIDHNVVRLQADIWWLRETIRRIQGDSRYEWREKQHSTASEALREAYDTFNADIAKVEKAHAAYVRQLEHAWEEFEHLLASGVDAEQARGGYQMRVDTIERAYQDAIHMLDPDLS
ncbi:DNA-binding PadR family transcriptional regulator [Thermosporothrix hazakensis]|jgi:DNA-binding PadR family transcriptional regulator|uniref:DNA-binding PadR family transcriptional regulator n=2 Tax=Thermosporothrix TaxID=768650 RepID=A0A326U8Q0_THEHA|nr:PadR family transcriptional regulator [Thermosporothrix hazakensis]PZW31190.1 DNA-binding PadR family transcriptional regulator [Thermosporothrix hazakensis]BBH86589.1 hypothetical protein KTC_13400 [Thermosporothrix sp. COM3]GCE50899.1 hypothetical protein KTH_57680 [Thermosporothrix hazakensis]